MAPKFFKALSDPNRLQLLNQLCGCTGPTSVQEASNCCDVDLSVVSRHLRQLKDAGLLRSERNGKEVLYSVELESFITQLRDIANFLETQLPNQK